MEEIYVAPSETIAPELPPEIPPNTPEEPPVIAAAFKEPTSLEDVILGLRGFGIEENEEILTFVASGRTIRIRISNIPTEQEMQALIATEEFKGYAWVQRIRCDILSR